MDSPRKLSQAVVQATQLLGMYQAELARILRLQCADIGELANGRWLLQPGTDSWYQAERFIRLFELLYHRKNGDSVAMCHWLRADNANLGTTPLLALVDELRIDEVVGLLGRKTGSANKR